MSAPSIVTTSLVKRWWALARRGRMGAVVIAAGATVLCAAPLPAAESRLFRAGAAVGDITPELGSMIVGGFSPTPSKQVHDPLQVRTLVLDDGAGRVALVVCDNIGLPKEVCDEAKRLAQERSGLAPSRVMISATHTHSGITAGTETSIGPNDGRGPDDIASYRRMIATRIADTIQTAIARLEPARIGWGVGSEPSQVFNRRWHVSDEASRRNPFGGVDAVRMNPPVGGPGLVKPAGPIDPQISFLSVQARDGRPLALFATYSLHYVGGIPGGVVSADYFAVFCTRIGQLLGADEARDPKAPPFVALLANGTSGDINNVNFREKRISSPPFEQMHRVANAVAAEVYRAYQSIDHQEWAAVDGRLEELSLNSRRPSADIIARARALLARPAVGTPWHPRERSYASRVLQRAEAPEITVAPLQVVRVGDVAIMTVPVEAFAEMGLELKAKTPFGRAFPVGLANAYYGYLPTPAQHQLGGYESWIGTNRIEPAAAPVMTSALLRMAAEMAPGTR